MKLLREIFKPYRRTQEKVDALKKHIDSLSSSPEFRYTDLSDKKMAAHLRDQGFEKTSPHAVAKYFKNFKIARRPKIDVDRAFEMRKQDMWDKEIAAKFGRKSTKRLTYLLDKVHANHPNYHPKNQMKGGSKKGTRLNPRKMNAEEANKIFELRKQGLWDSEIAPQIKRKNWPHMTRTVEKLHANHPNYYPKQQKHGPNWRSGKFWREDYQTLKELAE